MRRGKQFLFLLCEFMLLLNHTPPAYSYLLPQTISLPFSGRVCIDKPVFTTPSLPLVLEIADQFLFLGVHGNHRVSSLYNADFDIPFTFHPILERGAKASTE